MHEAVFQLKREFPGDSETLSGLHRRGAREHGVKPSRQIGAITAERCAPAKAWAGSPSKGIATAVP